MLAIPYSEDAKESLIDALTQSMTYFLKKGKSLEKEKSLKDIVKSIKDEKSFFPLKKRSKHATTKSKRVHKLCTKRARKRKSRRRKQSIFGKRGVYRRLSRV